LRRIAGAAPVAGQTQAQNRGYEMPVRGEPLMMRSMNSGGSGISLRLGSWRRASIPHSCNVISLN
jgi:hypothetical protein